MPINPQLCAQIFKPIRNSRALNHLQELENPKFWHYTREIELHQNPHLILHPPFHNTTKSLNHDGSKTVSDSSIVKTSFDDMLPYSICIIQTPGK